MLIQSMTGVASLELLERATLGRVACTHEGQPYITPMSVTYDANWLYSFSTLGQKITWMRANPHVCVEVEELVSPQDWATVIVIGRYQELTTEKERTYAHDLLGARPFKDRDGGQRAPPEARVLSDSYRPDHRASGDSRLRPTGRCMRTPTLPRRRILPG